MKHRELIQGWAVVEYEPANPEGDWRTVLCVRNTYADARKVLNVLEETDVDFAVYAIEGLGE